MPAGRRFGRDDSGAHAISRTSRCRFHDDSQEAHREPDGIDRLDFAIGSTRFETVEGAPPTLTAYLERVSLVSPADEKPKGVTLMTVHAAKGLEFPIVFVTGLEDGVFPSLRNGDDEEALEEERRLAYVAITRARERLFLTNARVRRLFGQDPRPFRRAVSSPTFPTPASPVRFVKCARSGPSAAHGEANRARAGNFRRVRRAVLLKDAPFHLGQRVRHSTYGEGEVRGLTGFGATSN